MVVTRAPEQAEGFVRALEEYGAEVILMPMVSYADPVNFKPLDDALRELVKFDWVVFTSQNAVTFFSKRARALGIDPRPANSEKPKIAAVGPATARAIGKEGMPLYLISGQYHGGALAKDLRKQVNGKKVLLPRSDRAGAELPRALRAAKAKVTDVITYRTIASTGFDEAQVAEADVFTFASPSAFAAFADSVDAARLRGLSESARFAAIGLTTAASIREAGFAVEIIAEEATAAGFAAAIAKYFAQNTEVKTR